MAQLASTARRIARPYAVLAKTRSRLRAPSAVVKSAARYGVAMRLESLAMLDRLGRYLQASDRVIVVCPGSHCALWASALKSCNVNAETLTEELDAVGTIGLDDRKRGTTPKILSAPLALPDQVPKRMLDPALILLAPRVLALPTLAVAVAVKLDSRGPVFFRQPRVGLASACFTLTGFAGCSGRRGRERQLFGQPHRQPGDARRRVHPPDKHR